MPYIPGTKLSSFDANLHATVLTNDKVMMTHGIGAGQIIKLEDWLILAGDDIAVFNKVQEQVQEQVKEQVQAQVQAQEQVQEQQSPKQKTQIGTKFRWSAGEDYRVAIVTAKGVLQVKSFTDGVSDTKKKMFADEEAWRASLPEGVTEVFCPDKRTALQKHLEKPLALSSDADKIYEYMQRFKIRTTVWEDPSLTSKLNDALEKVEKCRADLNNISIKEELEGKIRHKLNLHLYRYLRFYSRLKNFAASQENPDNKPVKLATSGKSSLRVTIGGIEYEVGIKGDRIMASKIAIRDVSAFWKPVNLFTTFKDMGNPKFYVIYQGRRHDLPL